MTKSDIIKEALEKYIIDYEKKLSPYEVGKDLFDEVGSGQKNLSKTYKQNLKGKINK
jgi:predicted DNA-binding protein